MKNVQKKLRGSFNVFSNSVRQLEVPLSACTHIHSPPPFLKVGGPPKGGRNPLLPGPAPATLTDSNYLYEDKIYRLMIIHSLMFT